MPLAGAAGCAVVYGVIGPLLLSVTSGVPSRVVTPFVVVASWAPPNPACEVAENRYGTSPGPVNPPLLTVSTMPCRVTSLPAFCSAWANRNATDMPYSTLPSNGSCGMYLSCTFVNSWIQELAVSLVGGR